MSTPAPPPDDPAASPPDWGLAGGDPFAQPGAAAPAPSYPPPPSPPMSAPGPAAAQPAPPPPPPPPPPPAGYGTAGYPAPGVAGPAYGALPRTSGKATAAMVLGILGVVLVCLYGVGVLAGIVALVLGYQARGEITRSGGSLGGSGQAMAGIILGWVSVGLTVLLLGLIVLGLVVGNHSTPTY